MTTLSKMGFKLLFICLGTLQNTQSYFKNSTCISKKCIIGVCSFMWSGLVLQWAKICSDILRHEKRRHRKDVTNMMSYRNCVCRHQYSLILYHNVTKRVFSIAACECVVYQSYGRSQGTFTSPNFPQVYPPNINCILYTFIGDLDEIVELTFLEFDLNVPITNK